MLLIIWICISVSIVALLSVVLSSFRDCRDSRIVWDRDEIEEDNLPEGWEFDSNKNEEEIL